MCPGNSSRRRIVASALVIAASLTTPGLAAAQRGPQQPAAEPLVLEGEGSFFVGGELKRSIIDGNKSGYLGWGNEDDIVVNQMYVQYQIPQNHGAHVPVVMLHGCCLSGKTWETTPDGRMGWSEYFVRKGWPVFIPDQTSRGRSGFDASAINGVRVGDQAPTTIPRVYTFGRSGAWKLFRFGPEYPTPYPDQQFPVAQFEEFAKQVIPDLNATLPNPNPTYANLAALSRQLGGAILMGHSESAFFPQRAALRDPSGIRGIISIEGACPTNLSSGELATLG